MADNEPQIAYLLIKNGALQSIAFSEGEAMANRSSDEIEIAEWPVKPLRPLPGGLYEYATEHIATDTADLGKLTSIDTLLEIAFIVRGREGWKCINVLPGLFGEKCFPPGVTMVWGREMAVKHRGTEETLDMHEYMRTGNIVAVSHCPPWSGPMLHASLHETGGEGRYPIEPVGPDPAGETA